MNMLRRLARAELVEELTDDQGCCRGCGCFGCDCGYDKGRIDLAQALLEEEINGMGVLDIMARFDITLEQADTIINPPLVDVCCDGCDRPMACVTEDDWDEMSRYLILCPQCDISCVSTDTLRRVGMLDRAARIERQWVIDRSLLEWVPDYTTDDDDTPF